MTNMWLSGDNFVEYVISFFMWVPKQTQVVMFVWQMPYPRKGPTILSFEFCYSYIMTVLLASQANSYVYKDYFSNPNKKIPQKMLCNLVQK